MALWPASELQLSLIASGAALVAAVWGYNKWQEYRSRRLAQRIFRSEHADVLLEGDAAAARHELHEARGTYEPHQRVEPVFTADASEAPDEDVAVPAEALPPELADPAIACLVPLTFAAPLAAPAFWAAQRPLLAGVEGRLCWLGLGRRDGKWRQLTAHDAAAYSRLVAALQLADRGGPIGEVELAQFFAALRQLAEDFDADIELPDAADVLAHARDLDAFCAGVDWRIALNVVGRDGSTIAAHQLAALIAAAGLRRHDDGLFHAEDEIGQTQFSLGSWGGLPLVDDEAGQSAGLTLTIDVPLVADGVAAFDRLLAFAQELTTAADCLLVDDQRTPLGEAALAAIRAKIGEFQQKMAERDIPAGGRRAMRLYS